MSANDPADALQRVNYFNGERLAAADFRAEQGYHMGMRRVLNRSLYSPGIVTGLEVEPMKSNPPSASDKHQVIVRRGLAFDHLGREIFLPTDAVVQVSGTPRSAPGLVFGNLLVISYRESRQFPSQSQCVASLPDRSCRGDLAWGAPTRVVADAEFEFLDSWPGEGSGRIVLSQIELSEKCEVVRASPGVRQYAVPAKPQTVRSLSLEGEKDIDKDNPKVLFFHVDGGYPESVMLYLRGRRFSTLFYSEIGKHRHTLTVADLDVKIDHDHTFKGAPKTKADSGTHRHSFIIDHVDFKGDFDMHTTDKRWLWPETDPVNPIQISGGHQHELDIQFEPFGKTVKVPVPDNNAIGLTGGDPAARTKAALSTLKDLVIKLDGTPITRAITEQLESRPGQFGKWKVQISPTEYRLNGTSLSQPEGTGEIDLLKLGVEIGIGQHKLEFIVSDPDVGGNLQYNLYVG
jgi:hypothetical protein